MPLIIPQNIIVESKYTAGKEYMFESTYREYIGYYYELNGKIFAGKEFSFAAPVLVKMNLNNAIDDTINRLLMKAATYAYGKLATKLKIPNTDITSFFYNYESDIDTRYFAYQINKKQIKEINKDTFDNIQKNPLFTSVKLSFTSGFNEQELKTAEQKIPGITIFVSDSYTPPPVEEDGTVG